MLYITELFPYPTHSGATIKSLNTIQTLSKKFNITLVCFTQNPVPQEYILLLKKYCNQVHIFELPRLNANPKNDLVLLIKNYLQLKPYLLFQFSSIQAKNFVDQFVENEQPEIIHIDHLNMTQYLPQTKKQLWIHEEHNIESDLAWSKFQNFPKWKKTKLFLLFEYLLIKQHEKKVYQKFDHIFSISDYDTEILQKKFEIQNISTQTLVYDHKIVGTNREAPQNTILFIGDITWEPNKRAVTWFIKEILPKICAQQPRTIFSVVGKCSKETQQQFSRHKNVQLHGYKKSIAQFLKNATVFVLPFHTGAGVRIKALTAAYNHIPMVSTKLGIQGLELLDKKHVLLAEDPKEFALNCLLLFRNKRIRQIIANAAYKRIKENHSIKNNNSFLEKYIQVTEVHP